MARIDRRRFRRTELTAPIHLQPCSTDREETKVASASRGEVKNLSLAGVYCHINAPSPLTPGSTVLCSLAVPREQTATFPFTRVLGKGCVTRLEPVQTGRRAGDSRPGDPMLGVSIAFASDVTVLGATGGA